MNIIDIHNILQIVKILNSQKQLDNIYVFSVSSSKF